MSREFSERPGSLTSALLALWHIHDVISGVIGNPITQTYPDVIVDLRGARVRVRVRAKARVTRGLRNSSPKSNVSACAARPFHDVIATRHYWLSYASSCTRAARSITSAFWLVIPPTQSPLTSAFSLLIVYAGRPLLTSSCLHHHWLNYASPSSIFSYRVIAILVIGLHTIATPSPRKITL